MPDLHHHAPLAAPIGFAHRGGVGVAPQNTLRAFASALAAGATGLESDVWFTADGEAVLDHDGLVAPGKRRIGEFQRSALPRHIPTLAELYEQCGMNFELSLDILDPRAVRPVVAAARRFHAADRLWVVGEWPKIQSARSVDPETHVVANLLWWQLGPGLSNLLRSARAAGICGINLPFWLWNPALVKRTHDAGLLAFGWRANDRWQIDWLRRCGCDGIYSDSVGPLVDAIS
ncbi:MAG TPA: glycerophosphodiester phosphodiesterase [Mycobacteriales bacterium]|nr:glycerophosphodiester phosphodiesterase [Mycobacteriales bacterium]